MKDSGSATIEPVRGPAREAAAALHDLDLLSRELADRASVARLRKLGFELGGIERIARERGRLALQLERRWILAYDRAHQRYGRAVAAVRDRVCSGCFITLPSIARPRTGDEGLMICQSCARLLYWV